MDFLGIGKLIKLLRARWQRFVSWIDEDDEVVSGYHPMLEDVDKALTNSRRANRMRDEQEENNG